MTSRLPSIRLCNNIVWKDMFTSSGRATKHSTESVSTSTSREKRNECTTASRIAHTKTTGARGHRRGHPIDRIWHAATFRDSRFASRCVQKTWCWVARQRKQKKNNMWCGLITGPTLAHTFTNVFNRHSPHRNRPGTQTRLGKMLLQHRDPEWWDTRQPNDRQTIFFWGREGVVFRWPGHCSNAASKDKQRCAVILDWQRFDSHAFGMIHLVFIVKRHRHLPEGGYNRQSNSIDKNGDKPDRGVVQVEHSVPWRRTSFNNSCSKKPPTLLVPD